MPCASWATWASAALAGGGKRSVSAVRLYREGDGAGINELFVRVFGRQRPLAMWEWRFLHNPAHGGVQIAVAEDQGRIVGQYAGAPRDLWFRGERAPALQILDNFIDADYRAGARLQRQMFDVLVEHAVTSGIGIGFGYPNPVAYKVGKRFLGYRDVLTLRPLFRRLNWRLAWQQRRLPGAGLVRRLSAWAYRLRWCLRPPPRGVRLRRVERFDERADRLWQRAADGERIIGIRDQVFLNWRFVARPGWQYDIYQAEARDGELLGYMVLHVRDEGTARVGYVVDYLASDPRVLPALLARGLCHMARDRVDFVLALAAPANRAGPWLHAAGFRERDDIRPVPVVYYAPPWVAERLGPGGRILPEEIVLDGDRWYLTYADTETI